MKEPGLSAPNFGKIRAPAWSVWAAVSTQAPPLSAVWPVTIQGSGSVVKSLAKWVFWAIE